MPKDFMAGRAAPASLQPYQLAFPSQAEAAALYNFYADNQHPNIHLRDRAAYDKAVAAGLVVAIKDPEGEIVAAAIAWPQAAGRWLEFGALRRGAAAPSGFPMMEIMYAALLLKIFHDGLAQEKIVCDVHQDNHAVIARSKAFGFQPWEPDPQFRQSKSQMIDQQGAAAQKPVAYFHLPPAAIPVQARFLLDGLRDGHGQVARIRGKENRELWLDFSAAGDALRRPNLEKMAAADRFLPSIFAAGAAAIDWSAASQQWHHSRVVRLAEVEGAVKPDRLRFG